VINKQIEYLWTGEKSAEEVGRDAAAEVNKILAEEV